MRGDKRQGQEEEQKEAFGLRVSYGVNQLADMAGLSPKELRTILRHEGIVVQCPGERRRAYVFITDLQAMPRFWNALLLKLGLEAAFRSAKMAPDEEI